MICISTNWVYKGRRIASLVLRNVILSSPLRSQKNEIGLLVGGANYLGDISFHLSKTRPAFGIFFKKHFVATCLIPNVILFRYIYINHYTILPVINCLELLKNFLDAFNASAFLLNASFLSASVL